MVGRKDTHSFRPDYELRGLRALNSRTQSLTNPHYWLGGGEDGREGRGRGREGGREGGRGRRAGREGYYPSSSLGLEIISVVLRKIWNL